MGFSSNSGIGELTPLVEKFSAASLAGINQVEGCVNLPEPLDADGALKKSLEELPGAINTA